MVGDDANGLNTSIFMHSKLGLLDNQVTVNYDLTLPTDGKVKVSKQKKFAKENNFKEMTQDQLDKEIDYENNVDLETTMWMVIRNKKSSNTILKRYETKGVTHSVMVNDIIKFGRVNFKVSVIKSKKLKKSI